ncbi:MAG TPA: copper amine oxidase N-terminal domain-containing protein [Caldisericia bacterium]|nr:copper amine oxidase N-terminal domain-containing protein [Caldisericia bacterium]
MKSTLRTFSLVFILLCLLCTLINPVVTQCRTIKTTAASSYTLSTKLGFGGILLQWTEMPEAKHGYFIYKMDLRKGRYQSFPLTDFPILETSHITTKELDIGQLYCFTVYPVGEDYKKIDTIHTNESCIEYTSCQHTLVLQIGSHTAIVDCDEISLDAAPTILYDRTFVPFRIILEAIGADIEWLPIEKKIKILYSLSENPIEIELQIGNPQAILNGEVVQIDPNDPAVVPCIQNGRTLIPLRFVGEALQMPIEWFGETKKIWLFFEKPSV